MILASFTVQVFSLVMSSTSYNNPCTDVSCVCLPCSSRMMEVQMSMAERAIELLRLPEDQPSYILDVG